MVITSRNIKSAIYGIVAFLIIFNPPISKSISFTTMFVVISFFYCLLNINTCIYLFRNSRIRKFVLGIFSILIYSLFLFLFNYSFGNKIELAITNLKELITNNISLLVLSIGITVFLLKNKASFKDFIDSTIIAGVLQSIIGLFCLASPSIKYALNTIMSANSRSSKIASSVRFTSGYRNFGFASSLYDIFGLTMSIIALVALIQAVNGKKKYYLYASLIAAAALLNARTSLIILAFGVVIIYFTSQNGSSKGIITKFISFLFLAVISFFLMTIFLRFETEYSSWFAGGFEEIKSLLIEHQYVGYFDALFNKFIFFPDSFIQLLFGTGLAPAQAIRNSDVGYIQNIWQFGIIGSLIIYRVYFNLFSGKTIDNNYSVIALALIVSIAVYLIKLNCLGYSMASVIFVPMVFCHEVLEE